MDHDISPAPARINRKAERVRGGAAARQRRKRDLDRLHDQLLAASNTREHRLVQALIRSRRLTEREASSRRLVADQERDIVGWWIAWALAETDLGPSDWCGPAP